MKSAIVLLALGQTTAVLGGQVSVFLLGDRDEVLGTQLLDDADAEAMTAYVSGVAPPMDTSATKVAAALASFQGEPNRTIDKPFLKKSHMCQLEKKDVNTFRHFSDTTYAPTNTVCDLAGGTNYTWLVSADGQMSFGPYVDSLEWGMKHANLAFGRTAWVGGELHVPSEAGAPILWNLNSGTFSYYVAGKMRPDDPDAYLAEVFYPKILPVWATEPCAARMVYTTDVLFNEDKLPTYERIAGLCEDSKWMKYDSALTWKLDPEKGISACSYILEDPNICVDRSK